MMRERCHFSFFRRSRRLLAANTEEFTSLHVQLRLLKDREMAIRGKDFSPEQIPGGFDADGVPTYVGTSAIR